MLEQISICLTALYLRGIPRPVNLTRRRWVRVVSCLRCADCSIEDAPTALRSEGFWEEAVALETAKLVDEATMLVEAEAVLTAVHPFYPTRWMERLGQSAPPALWIRGRLPDRPLLGIVGSRNIDPRVRIFAGEIGSEAHRLGYAVVSGGAAGCDNAGAAGAVADGGTALEILPHGIDQYGRRDRCGISACAPEEVFTTASAMERNALIYAASEHTVVVQAQFKEGGTWIGAVEATRRRLCPLIVRDDATQASRALVALGATPLATPAGLGAAIARAPNQRGLFGIG